LHLAFGLGVRNQIHVQITDIIQELADPPAVSSLTVEVQLARHIERRGGKHAPSGLRLGPLRHQVLIRHITYDTSYTDMAALIPSVLDIGREVRHTLVTDIHALVRDAIHHRHLDTYTRFPSLTESTLIA